MADLPLTIIGGYLGAGKTSLINHLLRHADGLRLAVLVNEFGSLSIDEDLLLQTSDEANVSTDGDKTNIISIAGGCVCCSYGNDLTLAMMELLSLDPQPDHVVLESSGVAIPGSIAASVSLIAGYAVDGIVVVANTETVREQAEAPYIADTIKRQLEHADILILNKTDLVEPEQREGTIEWVHKEVPGANIVSAEHGQVPPDIVMQSFLGRERGPSTDNHDTTLFTTVTLSVEHRIDATRTAQVLAEELPGIVRAKGFVRTLNGELTTIQVVGRRWVVSDAPEGASLNLVVIGHSEQLDESTIRNAIAAG